MHRRLSLAGRFITSSRSFSGINNFLEKPHCLLLISMGDTSAAEIHTVWPFF